MLNIEMAEMLVEVRRVLGTPYITINDRSFYVMLPHEAFRVVTQNEVSAESFEKFDLGRNIFYIAEVTL